MQYHHSLITRLSPLALAISLVPGYAMAQTDSVSDSDEKSKPKEIEELVVIGEPVDSLLTTADLDRKQANDLDDIFSGVPTVLVGGSVGAAQKIYVRNLGEDTLNISVDGATQSGVTYHHTGRISVEPELLKQVHVQVGAGDATSGPGALGGAIKFETKDPEDLLGNRNFGGIVKAGYFSNTEGYKGSGTVFGRLGDTFSAMASYVTSDQDDMQDPNGNELPGTNSDQDLGFVKFVGDFGGGHKASISYENLAEEGEKLTRPEWGEGPRNPLRDLEFERATTTAKYSWDKPDSDLLLLDVSLYNTDFEIYRPWDDYASAVDTQGFVISNTSQVGEHNIVYGSDYRDDEVTAGESALGGNAFTETSDVLGFFVQDRFQATEALLFTFGTRWDDFNAVDKENNEFTSDGFSPNVGFAYDLTRDLTFSGGYAESLRGVETNDGFKLFGTTNDPDLKAERAKNFELGLDYTLGSFLLSAGYHDTTIEDAIGNDVPWSRHYENLGELETNGYSLGATYNGERLFSKWTYVDTDVELDGEPLTRYSYGYLGTSTGNTLTMDTSYQVNSTIDVGWIMTLVQDLDDIYVESAGASISKPGYNVHDIYAHWEPSGLRGFSVTLTVKNVFDEEYLDHGSVEDFTHLDGYTGIKGYPAPGQDIRLSMALRF
ncbi:TonB-dependent receptor [Gilvimarinus xylanilyticus]|uniref:TonB-dependent receptor n=1 Tax=Gilvimarinus xylanilyticus TaxID=2944139 RepID=A0A9X2HSZ8_9GAMM|nr:TonB-dependent receptor [Gilvimarinus xylanilyticus]MCP8897715.1 TonB-dependent receptor [Gilvimarinus xylanilyticus]